MKQNKGIIDVHSHIIPKADDGSRYIGETLELLKASYRQGVRGIIATPHYIRGHNKMDAGTIRKKVSDIQELARRIAPDLTIYSGQELLYFDGSVEYLKTGRILTLGEARYVLVEFLPSVPYGEVFMAVRNLMLAGYFPILAHIERYQCLRKEGCVEELIHAGAYMQMNFKSLVGMKHLAERAWCRKMLLEGKIHLLGSDMHRLEYRPPEIEKTTAWITKRGGEELFEKLTWKNPSKVLSGELI